MNIGNCLCHQKNGYRQPQGQKQPTFFHLCAISLRKKCQCAVTILSAPRCELLENCSNPTTFNLVTTEALKKISSENKVLCLTLQLEDTTTVILCFRIFRISHLYRGIQRTTAKQFAWRFASSSNTINSAAVTSPGTILFLASCAGRRGKRFTKSARRRLQNYAVKLYTRQEP